MITVDQIPWPTWCAIGALGVTLGALLGSIIAERRMVRVAAVAFLLLALCSFTAGTFAEAPRPAAVIPAPSDGMREGRPDQQRTAAPSTSAAGSPLPVVAIDTRVAPRRTVPDRSSSGTSLRGRASWVRASLGARYMAARLPRGTILRVCGPLACFTGTVTDYGPSRRIHPDRIVDLSRARFAKVCGDPELLGTCPVRVWVVNVLPPETDTDG